MTSIESMDFLNELNTLFFNRAFVSAYSNNTPVGQHKFVDVVFLHRETLSAHIFKYSLN